MPLVIKRYVGQGFRIGRNTWIYLNESGPTKASITVIADKDIPIIREELLEEPGPLYKPEVYGPNSDEFNTIKPLRPF